MTQWLRPPGQQGPGIGEQFAKKAATNIAAKEAAKLGLGAAGAAVGGPLGSAAGTALGELAGPLAGQLVGQLFNKGGAVYLQDGGFQQPAHVQAFLQQYLANLDNQRAARQTAIDAGTPGAENIKTTLPDVPNSLSAPAEKKAQAPAPKTPTTRGTAAWDIPLGQLLGADISTQGGYTDMRGADDAWNTGLKASWSFEEGGSVGGKKSSIWDSVKKAAKHAWKNDNRPGDRWAEKNQKPQYKAIGGMTKGPLGMTDMLAAGKDKDISKVKMKKTKGDMSEEMEYSYHPPLAAKPKTGE